MGALGRLGVMKKRSVVINGHRTSVSLEDIFWTALKALATENGMSVSRLVTEIDRERDGNLSSAIRVYVLLSYSLNGNGEGRLTAHSLQ